MSPVPTTPTISDTPSTLPPILFSQPLASLPDVPPELLTRIVRDIDQPTTVSLAQVCRRVSHVAIDGLWRDLDLSHERPLPQLDNCPEDDEQGSIVALNECRTRLRRRLEAVVSQGEGRWEMVQFFRTLLRPGSEEAIVKILESAAGTIRRFEVQVGDGEGTGEEYDDNAERGEAEGVLLDVELARHQTPKSRLTYPPITYHVLTHITLGQGTVNDARVIPLLFRLAPNLTSLDLSISDADSTAADNSSSIFIDLPQLVKEETKLTRLRLIYLNVGMSINPDKASYRNPFDTVLSLIEHSPHIRQLSFGFESDYVSSRLISAVGMLKYLEDACWKARSPLTGPELLQISDSAVARREVIDHDQYKFELPSSMFWHGVQYPSLEVVLIHSGHPIMATRLAYPPPALILPLSEGFANWLHCRPSLRHIYIQPNLPNIRNLDVFADLDEAVLIPPNCTVSSIRHGMDELLIVKILLYDVVEARIRRGMRRERTWRMIYGSVREGPVGDRKVMERGSEPCWQTFTRYDGYAVPLEVIVRVMEAADQAGVVDWAQRGVEVNQEAWRILTDWRGLQPPPPGFDDVVAEIDSSSEAEDDDDAGGA